MLAKVGKSGAANSLHRLVEKYRFLDRVRESQGDCSHVYRINVDVANLRHSLRPSNVRKCLRFADHDAFRKGRGKNGLGKSAGLVYLDFAHFRKRIWDEIEQFCMVCGFLR